MAWWNLFSRRSAPANFEDVIRRLDAGGHGLTVAGEVVSYHTALETATALACGRVIADGMATPELHICRTAPDGRNVLATDERVYRLLNRRPNEFQTSFEFRRSLTLHCAFTGNALAIKVKVGRELRELIPVVPGSFTIERRGRYDIRFRCHDEFGLIGEFGPADVLHLPNLQWDLIKGLDSTRLAAKALGLSIAAEKHQATLHQNGGRPAGILSTSNAVSQDIIERLRKSWKAFSESNRNGTAILDNGFKYEPLSASAVDNQHLETRRFQVEEICRAWGVFPIMVGHSDKSATFASSEAFFAAHDIHTLEPWRRLWCERLDEFVLDGAGPLFAKFDTRYLRAGSIKDRAVHARTMAEMGIYTRNELREIEGLDPLPGLDEPLTPLNMSKDANTQTGGDATNAPQP